jgi:23S rRNA (guanosine2251-2'-O)-methyltransferase
VSASRYSAGIHAVQRLLRSMPERVRRVYLDERSKNPRLAELRELAKERDVGVQGARSHRLDDMAQGTSHQGVVAELHGEPELDEAGLRTAVEAALAEGREPLLLILEGVQDPHNLGACLRTAEAAGVDAVVVPRRDCAGITPAVRKVASGAAELLPLVRVASLVRTAGWLADYGVRLIGTSDGADTSLWQAELDGPLALVMGAEGPGITAELAAQCHGMMSLPMAGCVESLNVSVAAGICLYEIRRRRLGA